MGIEQVDRGDTANNLWYAGIVLVLGLATTGFLAFVGLEPDRVRWPYLLFLIMLPTILLGGLGQLYRTHPPALSPALRQLEQGSIVAYVLLLALAVVLDVFVVPRGSGWSVAAAVLPALPCLYLAVRVLRG